MQQAGQKNGSQAEQALGRSRGGFSSKHHLVVDALGNSLRLLLTGGQRHDVTQAEALLQDLQFDRAIADKAYDADTLLLAFLADQAAEIIIPPRSNRREQRDYDKHLYKERHLVECFINKLNQSLIDLIIQRHQQWPDKRQQLLAQFLTDRRRRLQS
ncbi:MAG: IS5 family transposase [Caldilineales bacterium]